MCVTTLATLAVFLSLISIEVFISRAQARQRLDGHAWVTHTQRMDVV